MPHIAGPYIRTSDISTITLQIDIPGAASEDELRQVFGLYGQTTGKGKVSRSELPGRPLELFMCSVLKRQGYGEGFRWISQYLD